MGSVRHKMWRKCSQFTTICFSADTAVQGGWRKELSEDRSVGKKRTNRSVQNLLVHKSATGHITEAGDAGEGGSDHRHNQTLRVLIRNKRVDSCKRQKPISHFILPNQYLQIITYLIVVKISTYVSVLLRNEKHTESRGRVKHHMQMN